MVARLGERQTRGVAQLFDDAGGEPRRGVETGPHGGPAKRQLRDPWQRIAQALDPHPHLCGVSAELLSKRHRRGIHEVSTAGLDDGCEFARLALERAGQRFERRDQLLDDALQRGDVDR